MSVGVGGVRRMGWEGEGVELSSIAVSSSANCSCSAEGKGASVVVVSSPWQPTGAEVWSGDHIRYRSTGKLPLACTYGTSIANGTHARVLMRTSASCEAHRERASVSVLLRETALLAILTPPAHHTPSTTP